MSAGETGALETAAPSDAPRQRQARRSSLSASSVLLASHDTDGARAAEQVALDAVAAGGRLHHLVIVPEFWAGMTGDGWRCNGSNVRDFCDYLEGQLEREILEHLERVHVAARACAIEYSAGSKHGPLESCLIEASREADYDLLVIGSPRPKGTPGFRSRINLDRLTRGLRIPLVVAPHPGAAPRGQP